MSTEQIVNVDPTKVRAQGNIRFGVNPLPLSLLMDSILEHGGVMEPCEVTPTNAEGVAAGFEYDLTYGFRRHEAVTKLNAEKGAGLTLPVLVRELAEDPTARTRRQIAENNDRENLSPMDKATAIKRLMDEGVERGEIRRIFSASGGRKGQTVQPMSNAMLNILLNLLKLPKGMQEKVHSGLVGVEGAYMLGKVAPEKRADVLAKAEADRLAFLDAEERDETKILNQENKSAELDEKIKAAEADIEAKKAAATVAEETLKEAVEARKKVKTEIAQMDTPIQAADVERSKAAEANETAAAKLKKDAANALAKALKVKTETEAAVKRIKEKLAAKAKGKVVKPIGKTAVKKAAAAVGAKTQWVALNISDVRQSIKDMLKEGVPARVSQIGKALERHLSGEFTTKELIENLAIITGEKKAATTAAPAKK